jgi:hypothetical protein
MKNLTYILISLTFFSLCTEQEKRNESKLILEKIESKEPEFTPVRLIIDNTANEILMDWSNYYNTLDSSFSLENFFLEHTDTLFFIPGNVFGIFDKEFDRIYNDFIVFSPDKKKYIDFDSYQMTIDKNNNPISSPDQEINLVDVNKKTVLRIGFNGPSQWVDNAFWENDTIVVLLENSSEKELRVSKIDIVNKYRLTYKYFDTLSVNSSYPEIRLSSKGLNTLQR